MPSILRQAGIRSPSARSTGGRASGAPIPRSALLMADLFLWRASNPALGELRPIHAPRGVKAVKPLAAALVGRWPTLDDDSILRAFLTNALRHLAHQLLSDRSGRRAQGLEHPSDRQRAIERVARHGAGRESSSTARAWYGIIYLPAAGWRAVVVILCSYTASKDFRTVDPVSDENPDVKNSVILPVGFTGCSTSSNPPINIARGGGVTR